MNILDIIYAVLWILLGALGSYLGNRAILYRYDEESMSILLLAILAFGGLINFLVVLTKFGGDCFKTRK